MRPKHEDDLGASVPAQHITTELEWNDLVLPRSVLKQLETIRDEIGQTSRTAKEPALKGQFKRGLHFLFRGPAGTGKTLTATLISKATGRDMYRIDLSRIVSKYIGETEKNLTRLFGHAESADRILLFDEADALFGKRTDVKDAHDRYVNLDTAYLLQRMEDHTGVVILTTNAHNDIDSAFLRRLRSVIDFPMPDAAGRLRLWRAATGDAVGLAPDVNLKRLATTFEITGGDIVQVVQRACLHAAGKKDRTIDLADIEESVSRQLRNRNTQRERPDRPRA